MRFLFIDRFLKLTNVECVVGLKSMSGDFLKEHFPGKPVIPGTLVIEAIAQMGFWLVIYGCRFKYGVVLAMLRDSVINREILPGDKITCRTRLVALGETVSEVEATGYVGDELVARTDAIFSHMVEFDEKQRVKEVKRFNYLTGLNLPAEDFILSDK